MTRWIAGVAGMFVAVADGPWTDWLAELPQSETALSEPLVSISPAGQGVRLTFKGTLQSAPAADGPWTDVPVANSPFSETPGEGQKFYRTREADGLFATNTVVAFAVTGPLQQHFDLALAGMPDGIFPPARPKPYFDGRVSLAGYDVPVSLRVRGNSSLQECPFPKLKFKVSKETRAGTPFAEAREVKIGTHCAEGGRGSIGRLREQKAAYREALAYEAMQVLGFVTPRVRRAQLDYFDTSPTNANPQVGWQVVRNAVILEDVEVVAERLGGRALNDEELAKLENANFGAQLIADLRFFHVLLGNWDFSLAADGRGLWNTDVIELADKSFVPVAGDFDLASWVTEEVLDSYPHDYLPDLPAVARRARYELEQIQKLMTPAQFAAARERFEPKKAALETQINVAVIDEAGRTNALRHVVAFFEALPAIRK